MALPQRNLVLLFTALVLGAVFARAQPQVQPDTFRVFSLGTIASISYAFDSRTNTTINPPSSSTYSRPYPVPLNGRLVFYRMVPDADPTKPAVKTVVAEIKLRVRSMDAPTPPSPHLLILIPSSQLANPPTDSRGNPLEFQTLLLDDSFEAHPKNHLRVINFSKRLAAVALANNALQLKSLESQNIPYPAADRAKLQVASVVNGNWVFVVKQTQMFQPNTRLTIFLSDEQPNQFDPNPVGVDLRKIPEIFLPDFPANGSYTP